MPLSIFWETCICSKLYQYTGDALLFNQAIAYWERGHSLIPALPGGKEQELN